MLALQAFQQFKAEVRLIPGPQMFEDVTRTHHGQVAHGRGKKALIDDYQIRYLLPLELVPSQEQRAVRVNPNDVAAGLLRFSELVEVFAVIKELAAGVC